MVTAGSVCLGLAVSRVGRPGDFAGRLTARKLLRFFQVTVKESELVGAKVSK